MISSVDEMTLQLASQRHTDVTPYEVAMCDTRMNLFVVASSLSDSRP